MSIDPIFLNSTIHHWLALPHKTFSREESVTQDAIHCDCGGFVRLLFQALQLKYPFCVLRPKAVHYFSVLQEIGSNKITQLKPGHLLAWRKQILPKSGDTGHIVLITAEPTLVGNNHFRVEIVDATQKQQGLSRRFLELFTDEDSVIIGVRLHSEETKIKRAPIYHCDLLQTRYCWGCALPKSVCSCAVIEPRSPAPNFVILRHPKERKRTLSTVSLIKQRYPTTLVLDGEQFSPLRMNNLLLLFPSQQSLDWQPNSKSGESSNHVEKSSEPTLILLDATWKKAKKMLHLNSWLQTLEHVALSPDFMSRYLLRKIPNVQGLSTLEAYAVAAKDPELAQTLEPFMAKHIELMGVERYQQNYQSHLNYENS